jgi:LDH2 family malate/lactate/ureidoglycolate dehydrogenase
VGGVKGSALSLIIDIICGILTGTVLTGGVKETTDMSGPTKIGHFFSALNISRFIDVKLFKANVDQVIRNIKGLPAINDGQIYMPGEIEYLCSRRRMKEGIPLAEDVVELLNSVATRYGRPPLLSGMP